MKRAFMTAIIFLSLCVAVQADSTSTLINYQGKLTDANGNVINGSNTIELRIYDAAVGGTLVWGPQVFASVQVEQGHFNVILSEDANQKKVMDAFLSEAPGLNERYLEITVETATIAPRQQIMSAPYAVKSIQAVHGDPVGSIQNYFGLEAPEGWLICNGAVIDKSVNPEYASLVDHLRDPAKVGSTAYQGTDANKAILPDLRGRTAVGAGQGAGLSPRALAQIGGEQNVTLTIDQMPRHKHVWRNVRADRSDDYGFGGSERNVHRATNYSVDDISEEQGGDQAHENMQPFIVLNYIIKY